MPEQSAPRREDGESHQRTIPFPALKGESYENHRYSCSGGL